MPNTKSAERRVRSNVRKQARNKSVKNRLQTLEKKFSAATTAGKKDEAQKSYTVAVPIIDSMVNKQIVHRNKAARHKSRLAARIRGMS